MSHTNPLCPKCRGKMEEGFVPDLIKYGAVAQSTWIEGAPERSLWAGMKTKGKKHFKVTTLRCSGCGYLEHYAK